MFPHKVYFMYRQDAMVPFALLCVFICVFHTIVFMLFSTFFTHNRRITGNPTGMFLYIFIPQMGGSMWWCMLFLFGSRVVRYLLLPRLLVCMFVPYYIIYTVYMCVCFAKQEKYIYIYLFIFEYLFDTYCLFMYILILMLISISSISGDTFPSFGIISPGFSVGCSPLGGLPCGSI